MTGIEFGPDATRGELAAKFEGDVLKDASLPSSVASRSEVLRQALAAGKQNVADEIAALKLLIPLTFTYGAKFGNAQINGEGVVGSTWSAINTAGRLIRWNDPRIEWVGGSPREYPGAGYGATIGGIVKQKDDETLLNSETVGYSCIGLTCEDFEMLFYGNVGGSYRLWVDGQPHSEEAVAVAAPEAGYLSLVHVTGLPRGRGLHKIKLELDNCLFGGFYVRNVDAISPPAGVANGGSVMVQGDSFVAAHGLSPFNTWALRMARRLGLDRLTIKGYGGTGFFADSTHSKGGTEGPRYKKALTMDRAHIPDDLALIVAQGSTNDSLELTGNAVTDAAKLAEIKVAVKEYFAYVAAQWPEAYVVFLGIQRPKKINEAAILEINTLYEEIAAELPNVAFIDPIVLGWFTGSAYNVEDGTAFYNIQSDNSHPTVAGQREIGDKVAAAICEKVGYHGQTHGPIVIAEDSPRNLPRLNIVYGGEQELLTGATSLLTFNETAPAGGSRVNVGPMWASGAPTRITFPVAGFYEIGAACQIAASAGGTKRLMSFRLNGATTFARSPHAPFSAAEPSYLQLIRKRRFAAGDYVEVLVVQDSGGTLKTNGVQQNEVWAELAVQG